MQVLSSQSVAALVVIQNPKTINLPSLRMNVFQNKGKLSDSIKGAPLGHTRFLNEIETVSDSLIEDIHVYSTAFHLYH